MSTPTIKGIFVKSHINAVKAAKGQPGHDELARRFGKPLDIRNNENVPIADEVAIINLAFDIISDHHTPAGLDYEAGRFHFRNFLTTPLAKFVFSAFRSKFKLVMMNAKNIAGHVFEGMSFSTVERGPSSVEVTVQHSSYPPHHFQGFLFEWMIFSGLDGTVEEKQTAPGNFVYTIHWKP